MKKFFKTLGMVIGLPVMYFVIQALFSGIYTIYLMQKYRINGISLDQTSLLNHLTDKIFLITLIANILTLIILFLIFLPTRKGLIKRCNFRKISFKNIIYIIILSIGLSMLTLILAQFLSIFFPSYKEISNTLFSAHSSIFKLIIVIVFAPLFEEIFFRGVIFGFLKKNFNIVVAIIVQASIFAIAHGNIVQGIYAFILGVVLALIYIYSNSLWGCILLHVVYNLFGTLILPTLLQKYPNINIIAFIAIALVCLAFSIIKMSHKKEKCIFSK